MREVNLAANEPMRPMLIDMEGSAKEMNATIVVAAAHEDQGALEWGAKVELEAFGEGEPAMPGLYFPPPAREWGG